MALPQIISSQNDLPLPYCTQKDIQLCTSLPMRKLLGDTKTCTPAVRLFFAEAGLERRLALYQQYTQEMISRDKNHPSLIMWSLANEPYSRRPEARALFRTLYSLAKSSDATQPEKTLCG